MPKSSLRVLDVLELLATEPRPLNHNEIALRIRIPKSSLTGLLNDLVKRRYAICDPNTRRYSLGAQVLAISKGYIETLSVARAGAPILTEVIRRVNENSALSIRDGTENIVIAQESCTHPLKETMVIGSRSPLHCTASGKVLLAFASENERKQVLGRLKLHRVTRHTITDQAVLRHHLAGVVKNGYAVCDEEAIDGVYAIAFPVISANGIAAALSTAIPVSRMTDALKRDVIATLREGSARISVLLGADLPRQGADVRPLRTARAGKR